MSRHRADYEEISAPVDAVQFGNAAKVDQQGYAIETQLQCGEQALTTSKNFAAAAGEEFFGLCEAAGAGIFKIIHDTPFLFRRKPAGATGGSPPDGLWRRGHLDLFMSQRIGDRIDQCGRGSNSTCFAATFHAERVGWTWRVGHCDFE